MELTVILGAAAAAYSALLAAYALWRMPGRLVRWTLAAGLIVLAGESFCLAWSIRTPMEGGASAWLPPALLAQALLPGVWLTFSFCYARGNACEFLARGWFWLVLAFTVPLGCWLWGRFAAPLPPEIGTVSDTWFMRLGRAGILLQLAFVLGAVGILMNLEKTFRTAVGTMRWRIKLVVMALAILFAARIYTSTQVFLFAGFSAWLVAIQFSALLATCVLLTLSFVRAGMIEIDLYPSRAVLQRSLTVFLAGIYLIAVGILSKLTEDWGGDRAFPLKALLLLVALVGLALFLLSDRVRQRLHLWISRHFRRPIYDYRQFWTLFTERTTSLLEETNLCRAVAGLLSETLNMLSVTVWLTDEDQPELRFGASTVLAEEQAEVLLTQANLPRSLLAQLQESPAPLDLTTTRVAWAAPLQSLCTDQFGKGGARAVVPLVIGGQLLGLITLSDRVSGVEWNPEDLDLLQCVGNQTAASLQHLQLAQQQCRSKELEAFQTLSAFFVHDLKNTAAMLSLMLRNLPDHFQNPAFRADALRGIGKTAEHINELIRRLSLLRGQLVTQRSRVDLNQIVSDSLSHLKDRPGLALTQQLIPLPPVQVDAAQIQSVVTNLLLNAAEAVGSGGAIQVRTATRNGWALVAVQDNGCGMKAEFVRHSLFRPFQSTKPRGMGIGLFQCKRVIEAHRGRIEVETEPGQGTTFTVLLPTTENG